jgi:hypothetical protein
MGDSGFAPFGIGKRERILFHRADVSFHLCVISELNFYLSVPAHAEPLYFRPALRGEVSLTCSLSPNRLQTKGCGY